MEGFIKSIKIEKVRHLEHFEIVISQSEKKHLILTGKNGSGKTTLLEKVRNYLKDMSDGNLSNIIAQQSLLLKACKKEQESLLSMSNRNLEQESRLRECEREIISINNEIERYIDGIAIDVNNIASIAKKYSDGEYILAYFNATRNIKINIPTSVLNIQLRDKYDIEENIGNIFLNYLVYLKTQQSFAGNEGDLEEVKKIQEWFDRLENALRALFEDDSITLKFNYKELDFRIYQSQREPYGFDVLSDGYSSVLDIIINIILRMEKKHKNAYSLEGIVLIDELENHLHIGLQKKILPFLTQFFPNIQFIVSTHSPFVINSIDDVIIFDLEKEQRVEDLSGIAYEGVVEGYFDINQYSERIKSKLERYSILVNKSTKNENESEEQYQLKRYLKGISPDLAPEVALAFNTIEIDRKNKTKKIVSE